MYKTIVESIAISLKSSPHSTDFEVFQECDQRGRLAQSSLALVSIYYTFLMATTVRCRGEFESNSTFWKPTERIVDSRSMDTYSCSQGSVLLKAAKANGFEANFWKKVDWGFMSMIVKAPPIFSRSYACSNIFLSLCIHINLIDYLRFEMTWRCRWEARGTRGSWIPYRLLDHLWSSADLRLGHEHMTRVSPHFHHFSTDI